MPIPDFQTLMLPLLKFAADGKAHTQAEAIDSMAKEFKLTQKEIEEMLPSGKQSSFDNRIAWAKFHMKKAGLFEFPRRAFFQITELGQQVLAQNPPKIGMAFLKRYPDYLKFITSSKSEHEKPVRSEIAEENATPEEVMAKGYSDIRKALASDLLERVINFSSTPIQFEYLVIDLLVKMGYGGSRKEAGKHLGKSGDGGIDGIIQEDKLGLDMIYIQAKCWSQEKVVSRPEIDKFIGALARKGAKKGVFITTSSFARGVRESESKSDMKIVLIDGSELADLMIDYNVGVSVANVYEIKQVDSNYFGDE